MLPKDEVVVAAGEQGKAGRDAFGALTVESGELPKADEDGLAVDGDVMHHRHEHLVPLGKGRQNEASGAAGGQVKGVAVALVKALALLRLCEPPEVHLAEIDLSWGHDGLHRFAGGFEVARPE